MNQYASSIIDHLKIPRFSKKANLLKDWEAIAKSHTIKAYFYFCFDELCGGLVGHFEVITICIL